MRRFVIVGGGLAGHRAAIETRRLAPGASITLLAAEPGLPYDRPPLSKNFLLGVDREADIVLRQAGDYGKLGIDHRPATPAVAIDRAGRRVRTADGAWLAYDALLLATGSRPRRLSCPVAAGAEVNYLRTLEDAARLRAVLAPGRRVAVIGGGFIGLEVASSARALGCHVTVIEREDRLLARGMPPVLSSWVARLHDENGVEIMLGARVDEVAPDGAGGASVRVPGAAIAADVVVAGIGVVPNTELAGEAGLAVEDGIVVDRACRTADPHVFAAGEVTSHPAPGDGVHHRVESWKVAAEQPLVAARSMLDLDAAFTDLPWLWSDQYGMNIQSLGRPGAACGYVLHGDPEGKAWTAVAMGPDERPVGAVAVNRGRDISMLRRAMASGLPLQLQG